MDGSPISSSFFTQQLNLSLNWAGCNTKLYKTHSLRIGRATDLASRGASQDEISRMGRWSSSAVKKLHKGIYHLNVMNTSLAGKIVQSSMRTRASMQKFRGQGLEGRYIFINCICLKLNGTRVPKYLVLVLCFSLCLLFMVINFIVSFRRKAPDIESFKNQVLLYMFKRCLRKTRVFFLYIFLE